MTINNVLLLLLALVCPAPVSMATLAARGDEGPVGTATDDGQILHRSKRGWMWNHFFLLEEYTGSDYQYVGKVRCCLFLVMKASFLFFFS